MINTGEDQYRLPLLYHPVAGNADMVGAMGRILSGKELLVRYS